MKVAEAEKPALALALPAAVEEEKEDEVKVKVVEEATLHPSEGRHSYSFRSTSAPREKRVVPAWVAFRQLRLDNAKATAEAEAAAQAEKVSRRTHEPHPPLQYLLVEAPPVLAEEAQPQGWGARALSLVLPQSEEEDAAAATAAKGRGGEEEENEQTRQSSYRPIAKEARQYAAAGSAPLASSGARGDPVDPVDVNVDVDVDGKGEGGARRLPPFRMTRFGCPADGYLGEAPLLGSPWAPLSLALELEQELASASPSNTPETAESKSKGEEAGSTGGDRRRSRSRSRSSDREAKGSGAGKLVAVAVPFLYAPAPVPAPAPAKAMSRAHAQRKGMDSKLGAGQIGRAHV